MHQLVSTDAFSVADFLWHTCGQSKSKMILLHGINSYIYKPSRCKKVWKERWNRQNLVPEVDTLMPHQFLIPYMLGWVILWSSQQKRQILPHLGLNDAPSLRYVTLLNFLTHFLPPTQISTQASHCKTSPICEAHKLQSQLLGETSLLCCTELYLLTYLLTYSMELSPSWEANWFCS